MLEVTDEVPGTPELIAWFGYWPSFHDAEVLDLELHRTGNSRIRIHAFEMTDQVNAQGFFVCIKHVIVNFVLEGVTNLHLDFFNGQNVISGLRLKQTVEGYEVILERSHGMEGSITADRIHLELQPGLPADSQYLQLAKAD
jgi:hypothetical protein